MILLVSDDLHFNQHMQLEKNLVDEEKEFCFSSGVESAVGMLGRDMSCWGRACQLGNVLSTHREKAPA